MNRYLHLDLRHILLFSIAIYNIIMFYNVNTLPLKPLHTPPVKINNYGIDTKIRKLLIYRELTLFFIFPS